MADFQPRIFEPIDPDFYRDRRVVVTGGRGFLGRSVCRALAASGAEVIGLGRADYNLVEQTEMRRLFSEQKPSVIIHLAAACGGIGANVANPGRFLYENALMGLMLVEEARVAETEKVVLISTTCAYPRDAPLPLQEDSIWSGPPVGATGPYGMAKRLLHEALRTYHEQYGLKSAVLLPANLYGPEDHFDPEYSHVVAALIRRYIEATAEGRDSVTNWGTGSPTREFMHVHDAARGILLAGSRRDDPAPVNLGTGVETSIRELTGIVAAATGYKGAVEWDTDKPDGQPRRYLDVSRAKTFGFEAAISLEAGVAETIAWYRAERFA